MQLTPFLGNITIMNNSSGLILGLIISKNL